MEETCSKMSRRKFLTATAAGVALTAVPDLLARRAEAAPRRRRFGPNDTINVGCIGPGGSKGGYRMGLHDARAAAAQPGVKVIARM